MSIALATLKDALSRAHPVSGRAELERLSGDAKAHAAVAAIVRERPTGTEVLFIRRADREGDPWSGHMAFPGGRRSEGDADLLATAVRETMEEVGLDLTAHAHLIGALTHVPAMVRGQRTGMVVAPFVFELDGDPEVSMNVEVREVVWSPLAPLLRGERATSMPYEYGGQKVLLPAYDLDGRIVWGLTHRMLENMFDALRPGVRTAIE